MSVVGKDQLKPTTERFRGVTKNGPRKILDDID